MLLIEVEIDSDRLEVLDGAQQIDQRPAKPINCPGHHDAELARPGILEHRVKARALVAPLGAADAGVSVGRDHDPARRSAICPSSRSWLSTERWSVLTRTYSAARFAAFDTL